MKAWINDKEFEFEQGETILHAAKRLGIFIPTLCAYLPLNHTPGTCRVCLVEVTDDRGRGQIVTACTTPLTHGMRVKTRTKRVREMQRWQVAWIFADHDQDCASCARHGSCELQDLALYVGLQHNGCNGRFKRERTLDSTSNGLVLDANKCIRCYRCVEVCRQVQGISALTMNGTGNECGVGLAGAVHWADSAKCVQCGQCSLVCPTGALGEKDQTDTALDWFADPEVKTVVAFAPAVRVTLGDAFQMPAGTNVEKRIVTALKQLGADYVCDINWAADVTIMEEGTELLHRLNEGGTLPMMTSCCPGWVNFVEKVHPEMIPHLSSTRSPQAIFGALAKTWFAREHGIDMKTLPDTEFDSPFMSQNTGAGAIFGVTGGVMEAAVRTVHHVVTGKELGHIAYEPARGREWVREGTVDLGEKGQVKIAVVHGLANVEKVIADINAGKCDYQFIEVMACPGGCIDGGGTIRAKNNYLDKLDARTVSIYEIDEKRPIRQSHNNPDVIRLYKEFLDKPLSLRAEDLLHTQYKNRKQAEKNPGIAEIWRKMQLA